jgi:hypothetical protein
MPLPIEPVTEAEWAKAPTVHDLLVRGRHIAMRDPQRERLGCDVRGHMRRLTSMTMQTMRARKVMETAFGFRGEVMQASTTRVVVDHAMGGPLIQLRAWNDAYAVISSYKDGSIETYSVGHLTGGRLLWSDELRLRDLRERFDRDNHHGHRLAEALGL